MTEDYSTDEDVSSSTRATSIMLENVDVFIETLKKSNMTYITHKEWLNKLNPTLSGIDSQIEIIKEDRYRLKTIIKEEMQTLKDAGVDTTHPGYALALKLRDIMPLYEKEIQLRSIFIQCLHNFHIIQANIVESIKAMGIAENVVKEQQAFLDKEWDRMQELFKQYIESTIASQKEQNLISQQAFEKHYKVLSEQNALKDSLIQKMLERNLITKEELQDIIKQNVDINKTIQTPIEQPKAKTTKPSASKQPQSKQEDEEQEEQDEEIDVEEDVPKITTSKPKEGNSTVDITKAFKEMLTTADTWNKLYNRFSGRKYYGEQFLQINKNATQEPYASLYKMYENRLKELEPTKK